MYLGETDDVAPATLFKGEGSGDGLKAPLGSLLSDAVSASGTFTWRRTRFPLSR